ncbi:MAG: hypothetical protein L3J98_10355 [Gammaproteobacteria bacterium]|nr:hypothetical protein [Gammaproteobacteria bacterium]MCF6260538.1 hypothetical protein [Gammaproteobacteria bacterium]
MLTTAHKKIKTLQQKTRLPETGEKSPHATTTTIGKLQVKVDVSITGRTLDMSLSRLVEPLRLFHPAWPDGYGGTPLDSG